MSDTRTIKIIDINYTVTVSDGDQVNENMHGTCMPKRSAIWISNKLQPDAQASTLLHEIIHAIAGMQGIELTEQDTRGLEVGLFSLLRNNKELIMAIADGHI